MKLSDARLRVETLAARATRRPGQITLSRRGPVATVLIDNPTAGNALTVGMMCQLADISRALVSAPPVCWTLRSVGGAFCAGGHLGDVRESLLSHEAGHAMARVMGHALDQLLTLPAVGICVLDGPALGGGAELATCTDLRVMSAGASLRWVQVDRGVVPGWGGAGRLVRHVGRARALEILAGGRTVSAEEAVAIGLAVAPVADCASDAADAMLSRWEGRDLSLIEALARQIDGDADQAARAFSEVWSAGPHRASLDRSPWGRR